jgi:hypothetical protein
MPYHTFTQRVVVVVSQIRCEGRPKKIRAWVVKSSTTITLNHQLKAKRKNQPIKLLCALKFTCDHLSLNINEHFLLQIRKWKCRVKAQGDILFPNRKNGHNN